MLWERFEGESEEAHAAFVIYRDLASGDRSLTKAAQECGKGVSLLSRWSSKWHWQKRVAAWDEEALRVKSEALLAAQVEVAEDDHSKATVLKNKIFQALDGKDLSETSVEVLVKAFAILVDIDRTSVGLSNSKGQGGASQGRGGVAPQYVKLYEGIDFSKV